jgi:hypothetical protein
MFFNEEDSSSSIGLKEGIMARRLSRQEALALPLLPGESGTEVARIVDSLTTELRPHGPILELYVREYAYFTLEARRLRQWKVCIIKNGFYNALDRILRKALRTPRTWGFDFEEGDAPETSESLTQKWYTDDTVKGQILELLGNLGLDETNIYAEAVRNNSAELELLDKMLVSAELRRDRTLRMIAEYRVDLAPRLEKAAQRIIDGQAVEVSQPSLIPSSEGA